MKMLNITKFEDPSHGWYKVPVALLERLNILSKISGFSYVSHDGTTAYLEEDCDADVFFQAYLDSQHAPRPLTYEIFKQYVNVTTKHTNDESPIRDLLSYPEHLFQPQPMQEA